LETTAAPISTPIAPVSLTSANLSALSIAHSPGLTGAAHGGSGSGSGSPRAAASERITPARQLLDQAADALTAEAGLFSGALLLDYDDYFLAAAVLLEKVR
jgi:hypothetical protein